MAKKQEVEFEDVKTPELALAGAIEKLTSTDAIELLANIDRRDIPRYALLLSIAEDFNLDWLKKFVEHELRLTCSIGGRRSEQIVRVAKNPEITMPESNFWDRIRGRVRR